MLNLLCKHFTKDIEDIPLSLPVQLSQLFHQARFIDCANLINHDLPISAFKFTEDTGGIWSPFACHWSNYDSANVTVHFIR